jgi:hypothetical protein
MSEYGAAVEWYLQKETEGLGEKPVPVPLCPPHIPHELPYANTDLRGEKPATNRLSYGMAILHVLRESSFVLDQRKCSWAEKGLNSNQEIWNSTMYSTVLI